MKTRFQLLLALGMLVLVPCVPAEAQKSTQSKNKEATVWVDSQNPSLVAHGFGQGGG